MEICANCERKIGNMEIPHVWQNSTVCAECLSKLAGARSVQKPSNVVTSNDKIKISTLTKILRVITGILAVTGFIMAFIAPRFMNVMDDRTDAIRYLGGFLLIVFGTCFGLLFVRRAFLNTEK